MKSNDNLQDICFHMCKALQATKGYSNLKNIIPMENEEKILISFNDNEERSDLELYIGNLTGFGIIMEILDSI